MPQFSTSSSRWAALQSRDPRAASAFVYCVTTTKIYCRSSCPSRLARRANITFHDTAAEAAAEGFRACKRCRPELGHGEGDPQKIAVEKACDLVRNEQHSGEDRKWSVKALATEVGLTESHFCRIFKKVTGMTVGEYRASLLPGNVERLLEGLNADHQQGFDIAQDSAECTPTSNYTNKNAHDNPLSLTEFDCSELEQDWNRFSGALPSMAMFSSPHIQFSLIDYDPPPLDHFSNSINLDMTDDGFQFLNLDGCNAVSYL